MRFFFLIKPPLRISGAGVFWFTKGAGSQTKAELNRNGGVTEVL